MNPISLIIMIILISLLVLVHEWGHYIAARIFGVRVTKFGFGMPIGPTLFKTKKGDLEILVHAFLLGGYVAFPDDDNSDEQIDLPDDSPERFKNQPAAKQAVILAAGVFMNVVFALFLIILAAAVYHKLPAGKSEIFINEVIENGYAATQMPDKFQKGDRILKVNGTDIDAAYKFIYFIKNSRANDGVVDKATVKMQLNELLRLNPNITKNDVIPAGTKLILPEKHPEPKLIIGDKIITGVESNKPKDNELVLSEDEIRLRDEIEGRHTYVLGREFYALGIANALADSYKPLDIVLLRDNKQIELKNIKLNNQGQLGLALGSNEIFIETKGPVSILSNSVKYMLTSTKLMYIGLWQLITGKIPASEMHGIVAIVKIGSDIIQYKGMLDGLLLTAIISIDLAIINLLPIPALDGGHLLFLLIEKLTGRPLNKKTIENISNVCFTLLIILMIVILVNDFWALATKKF